MSELLASCALAGALVLMVSHDASARWRHRRYWAPTYQYYYAPAQAATAPPVARSGTGYSYRSFSYDTAGAAPYVAPPAAPVYRYQQPLAPSQSHFFRADRKAHGLSWYRTE